MPFHVAARRGSRERARAGHVAGELPCPVEPGPDERTLHPASPERGPDAAPVHERHAVGEGEGGAAHGLPIDERQVELVPIREGPGPEHRNRLLRDLLRLQEGGEHGPDLGILLAGPDAADLEAGGRRRQGLAWHEPGPDQLPLVHPVAPPGEQRGQGRVGEGAELDLRVPGSTLSEVGLQPVESAGDTGPEMPVASTWVMGLPEPAKMATPAGVSRTAAPEPGSSRAIAVANEPQVAARARSSRRACVAAGVSRIDWAWSTWRARSVGEESIGARDITRHDRRRDPMDVLRHNRDAWDRNVAAGNRWTVPVGTDVVARARAGDWSIVLTPTRPVPREWLGEVRGKRIFALASGGGQQGPYWPPPARG